MSLKVSLDSIFTMFDEINEMLPNSSLLEISIKQHQISLTLEDDKIFYLSDALSISHDILVNPQETYVTHHNGFLYLNIESIPDDVSNVVKSKFVDFVNIIRYMSEAICTCPMLEYVVSNQYVKCYLDKPGLKLNDIKKLEDLFQKECTLEFSGQRPYALFIN